MPKYPILMCPRLNGGLDNKHTYKAHVGDEERRRRDCCVVHIFSFLQRTLTHKRDTE